MKEKWKCDDCGWTIEVEREPWQIKVLHCVSCHGYNFTRIN